MSRFDSSLLVLRAGTRWKDATTAAFLDAINDGMLPPEAFNRWLVQDCHFADTLTSFQAIAIAKTPRRSRKSLIAGLVALHCRDGQAITSSARTRTACGIFADGRREV